MGDTDGAYFIGHSYGTFVCSWCRKYLGPSIVRKMALLDPVCFQVLRVWITVCGSATFRDAQNLTDAVISYFVFRELHTVFALSWIHWQTSELFPEETPANHTLVQLMGNDSIVPAQTVRRYLAEYEPEIKVIFESGFPHGAFAVPGEKELRKRVIDSLVELGEVPFEEENNQQSQGTTDLKMDKFMTSREFTSDISGSQALGDVMVRASVEGAVLSTLPERHSSDAEGSSGNLASSSSAAASSSAT